MPTGYTESIEKGQVTEFSEFALQCAREAFGGTIAMLDMPEDAPMTEENITIDTSYHEKGLTESKQRLEEVSAWTDEEARLYNQKNLINYIKTLRSIREASSRYGYMLLQVEAWDPPTEDHIGLKNFMREQLERSMAFDCFEPQRPKKLDGASFKAQKIELIEWEINYHLEKLAAEQGVNQNRIDWVHALRNSLASFQPVDPPARRLLP